MIRERVADNVYVFTSELYAQVNAGAVIGPDFSVVIDTLAYPEETLEIRDFVENKLGSRVRYVINTHYHADHALGNSWFKGAVILGHRRTRQLMDSLGRESIERARQRSRELRDVELVLPDVVFDEGELSLRVGKRTLQLLALPGHSPDGVGVLVLEDRVLFSGDAMMPLPHLVNGDLEAMTASLKRIPRLKLENVIQGHGEVILRGEILNAVRSNLNYIACVRREVTRAARRRDPLAYLASVTIESCGKSRILLGGLADDLHRRNLAGVYRSLYGEA
ncbi:MAG: MBL fold metallo-hydrolase [Chloroflexi bacterium]|nr:MBL fold metallo-hydrolase [Chloroflexota bacterium]